MKKQVRIVRFPLVFQITLLFTGLILFSLAMIGVISYRQIISKNIEPLIGKRLDFTARGIALRIRGETHNQILNLLTSNPAQFSQDKTVAEVHRLLVLAQRQNELTADIQTFAKDPKNPQLMLQVMSSNEDLKPGQSFPMDPYVQTVFKEGLPIFTSIFQRDGDYWISGLTPIESEKGDAVAVLRVDYSVNQEMQVAQSDVIRTLTLAGGLAFVFASFLGILSGRSLSKPVQILARAAQEVSGGNLEPQYAVQSQNEIGFLASSFKEMLTEIRRNRSELERYSKELEEKVKERTADLREANSQISAMLNCLGQGFFMFKRSGDCLSVYSKACLPLLEGSPEGKKVTQYLHCPPEDQSDWVSLLFEESLPFEELLPICPKKYPHSQGKVIELNYQPVRSEVGKVDSVIGIATDRTAEVAAMRTAETEKAFSKLVLSIADNRDQFIEFLRDSREIISGIKKSRQNLDSSKIPAKIPELMRGLHTLKGSAGIFHLTQIRELAHHYETMLSGFKSKTPLLDSDLEKFDQGIAEIEKAYEDVCQRFKPLLGSAFESGEVQLTVYESEVLAFHSQLKAQLKAQVREEKTLLKLFEENFLYEPLEKSFKHYHDVVQQAADSLGKWVEPLHFQGGEMKINPRPFRKVFSTFVHAFRNAVDHGLETPEERLQMNKPEKGRIQVEFSLLNASNGSRLRIQIKDDGRGVNANKVREKLAKLNPEHPLLKAADPELIQVLFDSGFSTREQVSDWSGRGVGMDAILTEAQKLGGTARIESTLGQGSVLTVELPLARG